MKYTRLGGRPSFTKWSILLVLVSLTQLLMACGADSPTSPATTTTTITTIASTAGSNVTRTAVLTNNPASTIGAATATPTVSQPTKTPVTVAPTPTLPPNLKESDQVLNIIGGEIPSLDPALSGDTGSSFVLRQVYSGLLGLDKDLKVVPDLAATLPDVSADGLTYTFTLRPGVKFHSGQELTADDIKYSWERASDPKLAAPAPASSLVAATYMNDIVGVKDKLDGKTQNLDGVIVKDKYTLQVKIDSPKPFFLAKMTYPCFYVVNKTGVAQGFDKADGSGPFRLAEYKKDQLIRLVRNAEFYNGMPRLFQVNILLGASAANSLTLYEQGKIDYVYTGGNAVEPALDKNNPLSKELLIKPQLDITYVAFNNRLKPFDDPKVRQAFSLVVDRDKIARVMFEGKVMRAISILPPGMPGYTGNPGPISYDVNRARDLIAQSSYRKPENLPKITLYTTGSSLAKVLQDVYKQAFNLEIEVRQPDYNDFKSGLAARQFQMYIFGWVADYPDPDNFLRALLGAGSAFNEVGYNNPQFDELLKQADQLGDGPKRLEQYGKAEQIALTDAPILPIYHSIGYLLVKPYVKGLDLSASGILNLKDVYILR